MSFYIPDQTRLRHQQRQLHWLPSKLLLLILLERITKERVESNPTTIRTELLAGNRETRNFRNRKSSELKPLSSAYIHSASIIILVPLSLLNVTSWLLSRHNRYPGQRSTQLQWNRTD